MSLVQRLFLIAAVCLMVVVPGCGGSSQSTAEDEGEAKEENWPSVEVGSKVTVPEGPPPKELEIEDLVKGSGPAARRGDEVEILYVDALYANGEVVSLAIPGAPFHLKLGAHSSVPGWEKGIVGMKVGGRRELIIPAGLAGGEEAHLSTIELVGVE